VDGIKIRSLGWAGHIVRMENKSIPNKVLNGKFHNRRPVGKTRKRWEGFVWNDTSQILGIRGWEEKSKRQRRMEVSSEGDQVPRRGCSVMDGAGGVIFVSQNSVTFINKLDFFTVISKTPCNASTLPFLGNEYAVHVFNIPGRRLNVSCLRFN
jgi:hypothetical protein